MYIRTQKNDAQTNGNRPQLLTLSGPDFFGLPKLLGGGDKSSPLTRI